MTLLLLAVRPHRHFKLSRQQFVFDEPPTATGRMGTSWQPLNQCEKTARAKSAGVKPVETLDVCLDCAPAALNQPGEAADSPDDNP